MSCNESGASPSAGAPEMIDCGTAMRMLWDFLDGHLGAAEEAAVRSHMDMCSHCFPHARFGELVLKAVAAQRMAPEPSSSLRESVLAQLHLEGYDGP